MQTFRFAKVTRYHVGTNKKSAFMEFILNNHYQIVYLYFSVFQLVLTNFFSIFYFGCIQKFISDSFENLFWMHLEIYFGSFYNFGPMTQNFFKACVKRNNSPLKSRDVQLF